MYEIRWTKEYQVTLPDRFAKVFLSEHDDDLFYGGVLYYDKSGSFTANTMTMHMKLRNFIAESEDEALSQCKKWIETHLGAEFTIEGPETVAT